MVDRPISYEDFQEGSGSSHMLKSNGSDDNGRRTKLIVLDNSGDSTKAIDRRSDNERSWTWLSRELHDGVTQQLWYLQTELDSLAGRLQGHDLELAAETRKLTKVAREAYQELRITLKLLSAWGSCDVRLAAELQNQLKKFSQTTGLEVELESEKGCSNLQIPGALAREISRLVQEALWNCLKHSQCKKAKVSLQVNASGMFVTVSDLGRGFDFDEIDDDRYGINNMRDRAKSINGKLYVTTGRGKGTKVTLFVPLEEIGANA